MRYDDETEDCVDLFATGDILYRVGQKGIDVVTITSVGHYPHCVYRDDKGHSYFNHSIRNTCFKTQEEAENELQRRRKIKEKREILKAYEKELNKKYGLENHFIVK